MRIAVHDFGGHPFAFELSRALARAGHEVGHFFFGAYPGPQGEGRRLESDPAGLTLHRLEIDRLYSTQALATRLRGNLAYAGAAADAIARFRPEVVLSGNTPTEIQGAVIRSAHRVGARFVYWMQDFYSLAVGSLLRQRWLGAGRLVGEIYRRLDRAQLARSDGIVLISDSFRDELARLGRIDTPTWTIPNWGAIADIDVRPKNNPWAQAHGMAGRFVYLYSGTLGLKHDPTLLLRLARALEGQGDALVVIAAQGAGRALLERELAGAAQPNLRLLDLQPIADLADMMGSADVMLALLEADAGRFSVPSKVLSYLCAGRPIVLSAPPENLASRIVEEARAGVVVPAGEPDAFVAAALGLRADPARAADAGSHGRAYAENHFDIDAIAVRFEEVLKTVMAVRRN